MHLIKQSHCPESATGSESAKRAPSVSFNSKCSGRTEKSGTARNEASARVTTSLTLQLPMKVATGAEVKSLSPRTANFS